MLVTITKEETLLKAALSCRNAEIIVFTDGKFLRRRRQQQKIKKKININVAIIIELNVQLVDTGG